MATEFNGYIPRNPGDLLTAEDWNDIQRKIKDDITKQIKEAIDKHNKVTQADNAHTLDNQTSDDLSKAILEQARQELPKRTGYQRIFRRLKLGEENIVKHNLGGCPLVDIYALYPFDVVCSEDDQKNQEQVYFYLYHSSEKRIRFTPPNAPPAQAPGVEIEPTGGTPFRIAFADMLAYYNVKYTDTSSLDDLETEFWEAFLADPNDDFDDDQYCHSPWFDRCCGERRTVSELKSRGDWDELWFKVMPRKTINMNQSSLQTSGRDTVAPVSLEVVHFDFNKLGITFHAQQDFGRGFQPSEKGTVNPQAGTEARPQAIDGYPPPMQIQNLMVLLKV